MFALFSSSFAQTVLLLSFFSAFVISMPFKVITAILILFIQGNRIVFGSTQKPFKRSLASRGLMSLYLPRLLKPKSG